MVRLGDYYAEWSESEGDIEWYHSSVGYKENKRWCGDDTQRP